MTDNNQTTASKMPSHAAYHVREREGRDSIWTQIGSAWAHKDSKGFNLQLHANPLDGRIVLRVIADKESA